MGFQRFFWLNLFRFGIVNLVMPGRYDSRGAEELKCAAQLFPVRVFVRSGEQGRRVVPGAVITADDPKTRVINCSYTSVQVMMCMWTHRTPAII